ncbi:hypothetical protein AB0758_33110 [Tolypothrix bouteillei VB521301_2]|uniref:hypothetical protein n=1 Tax=Tolypothrix bouteillei TaxID=1246981 RepID=UPI000AE284F5
MPATPRLLALYLLDIHIVELFALQSPRVRSLKRQDYLCITQRLWNLHRTAVLVCKEF